MKIAKKEKEIRCRKELRRVAGEQTYNQAMPFLNTLNGLLAS
ncbi:hypothetical protein ACQKCH_17315 [Nubsella zeaxanthinifaciens]